MPEKRPTKAFDCLEFRRRVQAEVCREVRGMTPQQEIAYFERAAETGPLGDWWKKVRRATARSRGHHPQADQ